MAYKKSIKALELESIDSAGFDNTFQQLSAGTKHACFFISIVNDSDKDVFVSYDGITAHDYVAAGESSRMRFEGVGQNGASNALLSKFTPVLIKGAASGTGLVYIIGYYQEIH